MKRYTKNREDGGALIETSLTFFIFILFIFFTIDMARYFFTYGVLLYAAHEATDFASKAPIEITTTQDWCGTPEGSADCDRYRDIVEAIVEQAVRRAEYVASTEIGSSIELSSAEHYQSEDYPSPQFKLPGSRLRVGDRNNREDGVYALFIRPGERGRLYDAKGREHIFTSRIRGYDGDTQRYGEGWPDDGENWDTILRNNPFEVIVQATMRPVTPILPPLVITARQQGFRRSGIPIGTSNTIADLCPSNPDKTEPGVCGCKETDEEDIDLDLIPDCVDPCIVGLPSSDPRFVDSDGDGVQDCEDICKGSADIDSDGDGILDCRDKCKGGVDEDLDHDGIWDCNDDCITNGTPNKEQDTNGDGEFDCKPGCDPNGPKKDNDPDGDGILNCLDPFDNCEDHTDDDKDGRPDACGDDCITVGAPTGEDDKNDDGEWDCKPGCDPSDPKDDDDGDGIVDCLDPCLGDCSDGGGDGDDDVEESDPCEYCNHTNCCGTACDDGTECGYGG